VGMRAARPLTLVTAIGRRLDRSVCDGAVANAARSVSEDRVRADERRAARLAFGPLEPAPRRTG